MSLSAYLNQVPNFPSTQPSILTEFGVRLREMRSERQLSQVDLAWRIGITRAHLEEIEDGSETIDLDMLSMISDALDVSLATALRGL